MTCYFCSYQWCWICKSIYTSSHYNKLNPFGCPGLQYSNENSRLESCCKSFWYGVVLFLVYLVFSPLYMCLVVPFYVPYLVYKKTKRFRNSCSKSTIHCIGIFICYIFILIAAFILAIPTFICFIVPYRVVKLCRQKYRISKEASQ
jgi:E3 ubiquitin-protein ligase RNF19A